MTLIIDFTPEQEAEAASRGLESPDFVRLRLLENLPPRPEKPKTGADLT